MAVTPSLSSFTLLGARSVVATDLNAKKPVDGLQVGERIPLIELLLIYIDELA